MTAKKTVKSKDPTQKALGALKAMLNPESVIAPPEDFDEDHAAMWNELIASKPHESWRPADRFMLRLLVKSYQDILRLDIQVKKDGETILNQRGTPVMNPDVTARNAITQQYIALSTKLRLGATARDNDEEGNAGRNQAQKSAKKAARTLADDDDDLLASLTH